MAGDSKRIEADIAVVGAGAAGLMTAIAAARRNPSARVLLIDGRARIGAKILMSGGTRCNVTNARVEPADFNGAPAHSIRHVLAAVPPSESVEFFKEIGVDLLVEPTGKLFPATHSAKTVLDALIRETLARGVTSLYGVKVTALAREGDAFLLSGSDVNGETREIRARRVVLATGGLSHPDTGSDGTGLEIAKALGHAMVETSPGLTPLTSPDKEWAELSGVAADVRLSLFVKGKKAKDVTGAMLFTHLGFSGPAALDISRHWVRALKIGAPEIRACFLAAETEESLKALFAAAAEKTPSRTVKAFAEKGLGLPSRLAETLVRKAGIAEGLEFARFSKEARRALAKALLECPLSVNGVVGYKKAEVTAGGVDIGEVRIATMESKRVPGLYFAGEILDVDGRIGGFNFQWSWSTGTIAGRAAAESLNVA